MLLAAPPYADGMPKMATVEPNRAGVLHNMVRTARLGKRTTGIYVRWVTARITATAAVLFVILLLVYIALHISARPADTASLSFYAMDSVSTTGDDHARGIMVVSASGHASELDSGDDVTLTVYVSVACGDSRRVRIAAVASPEDATIESGDGTEGGRVTTDVTCAPHEERGAEFVVHYDADDVTWEQTPGTRDFALDLFAENLDAEIKLHALLEQGRFGEVDGGARLSSDRAHWTGTGQVYARGQLSNPAETSRVQVLDSILLLALGALAGVVLANLAPRAAGRRRGTAVATPPGRPHRPMVRGAPRVPTPRRLRPRRRI